MVCLRHTIMSISLNHGQKFVMNLKKKTTIFGDSESIGFLMKIFTSG